MVNGVWRPGPKLRKCWFVFCGMRYPACFISPHNDNGKPWGKR
jgi:hypothetical protein